MRRHLLAGLAIFGLLFSLTSLLQRVVAKEPTLDDRFRGPASKAPEAELPVLNPPQTRLTDKSVEAANRPGPAYLGVTFGSETRNAVVRTVAPGSPADQAGLQPQDVIETLQGITISSPQDVLDIVAKMRPGTMLEIGVSRRMSLRAQAALSSLPSATARSVGYPPDSSNEHELLPVPSNAPRNTSAAVPQSNRYTAPQNRSGSASGQPRNYNPNNGQPDSNRRFLGRRSR